METIDVEIFQTEYGVDVKLFNKDIEIQKSIMFDIHNMINQIFKSEVVFFDKNIIEKDMRFLFSDIWYIKITTTETNMKKITQELNNLRLSSYHHEYNFYTYDVINFDRFRLNNFNDIFISDNGYCYDYERPRIKYGDGGIFLDTLEVFGKESFDILEYITELQTELLDVWNGADVFEIVEKMRKN